MSGLNRRTAFLLVCFATALVAWLDARSPSAADRNRPVADAAPQRVRAAGVRDSASPEPTGPLAWMADRGGQEAVCPPGWCDTVPGRVLVKLAPPSARVRQSLAASPEERVTAREAERTAALLTLGGQGVRDLQPLFPLAVPPRLRATVVDGEGQAVPVPDLTRWYVAQVAEGADVKAAAALLATAAGVAAAEPDYLRRPIGNAGLRPEPVEGRSLIGNAGLRPEPVEGRRPIGIAGLRPEPQSRQRGRVRAVETPIMPTDPLVSQQWHLAAVNAPAAWQWLADHGLPPGGARGIVVAVIDTGVDYTHQDLAANIWTNSREIAGNGMDDDGNGYVDDVHGIDATNPGQAGNPMDDHGHGTHVAGIIAAQAGNGVGGVGIAYNVQIMALKAAQYSGVLATSDIAGAIYYAVAQGADVINMSFGGYVKSQVEADALAVAFGQAVLVAAAGNDGLTNEPACDPMRFRAMYPAAYIWVLGVMASKQAEDPKLGWRAPFSNWDCTPRNTIEYELMAPGVDVWSTLPHDGYAAWDGTSMATPVVAGIAALVRTRFSDKDVYSSRFIMGQIASNASPVANAASAITTAPTPNLSYLQHWLFDTPAQAPNNDNERRVDSGETIDLAIVIRNHLGKADQVSVKLEPWADGAAGPDPYVTMLIDTVDYGAIGSFNWDDNGLIYDPQGVITGVRHPFRFTVDLNTPNDHVIPFRLTMNARNGLDPNDTTSYSFTSPFTITVTRGREVSPTIDSDLTLTKDTFWIVPNEVWVKTGATLTIEAGTQVQFGAPPGSPYVDNPSPRIKGDGLVAISGTALDPVRIFPREPNKWVSMDGRIRISYAIIQNPNIVATEPIDHAQFLSEAAPDPNGNRVWGRSIGASLFTGKRTVSVRGEPLCTSLFSAPQGGCGNFEGLFVASNHVTDNVFLARLASQTTSNVLIGDWGLACEPRFVRNALLSPYWLPDLARWNRVWWDWRSGLGDLRACIPNNYWGTTSTTLINAVIRDQLDYLDLGLIVYEPFLETPPESAYPFVVDVRLATASGPTTRVGVEPVTFIVTFNRDMDQTLQPQVSFGPDVPMTDYTVHPINGGWQDARTWAGTFNINPITGDGYQLIRVAGARAADDPWLVTGDDAGRFRFEIVTSGTEAMNLQATGGEGRVDLMWTQNDFDLLAGYNLYRSTSASGSFTRINQALIPSAIKSFVDTSVQPGQPYFYKFTVVKTDMTDTAYSNVATATPVDTILPVIVHTPVAAAPPGLSLSLYADVSDNVRVTGVTLFYKRDADAQYTSLPMTKTTGNRWTGTIDGAFLVSPGLHYYIEATDGVGTATSGRTEYPWQVTVVDRPVVTAVSPIRGPAAGGTALVIVGSNFKANASVTIGGAVCGSVAVASENQITCTTPAHFPMNVDVVVTNPDGQSGTLLRGFTYESDRASASLPASGGGQHDIVNVPINTVGIAGLASGDVTVTFDATVLRATRAQTGTLTPGWTLVTNTATPGQIRIVMVSGGGTVSAAGSLALIEFEVIGAPGASSGLHLANIALNDGLIRVDTADGTFAVSQVYAVSGAVGFWNGNAGIPRASLSLVGDRSYAATTGGDGRYATEGVPQDDYVLTPAKSDDVNGISAYDASLALQHVAGLITLSGSALTAADVNRSGTVSAMDAFQIVQKAVDLIALPFQGAGQVWVYEPATRSYANLSSAQTGQDFTAILLGDVSGNWTPAGAAPLSLGRERQRATLQTPAMAALPEVSAEPSTLATVAVTITPGSLPFVAADLEITYDPTVLTAVSANKGSALPADWLLAANMATPGMVRVALAGATALSVGGSVVNVVFEATGGRGTSSVLTLTGVALNEGQVDATATPGRFSIGTCGYRIEPTALPLGAIGGSGTITVTAGVGCGWTAETAAPWITVTAPAGGNGSGAGVVSLQVGAHASAQARSATITIGGQSATVTQEASAPTIAQIAPTRGSTGAGTTVTITGAWFQTGATVTLGGGAATSVVVVNETTITAVTGAHAAGAVDVVVANPDAQLATLAGGFTYADEGHPADRNNDLRLVISEVTAYGAAWKRGDAWPVSPSCIPIGYVTRAGYLWRAGETYRYDTGACPTCWVSDAASPASLGRERQRLVALDSVATRDVAISARPDGALQVTIQMRLPSGAMACAVEETPPSGWAVSGVSDAGLWDGTRGLVRWGPFLDAAPRTLSYWLTPQAGARRDVRWGGTASVDGIETPVGGVVSVPLGTAGEPAVTISSDKPSPQSVGASVTLPAAVAEATASVDGVRTPIGGAVLVPLGTANQAVLTIASDKPSPQSVGTAVTLTAAVAGATAPLAYKWWGYDGTEWRVLHDWNAAPSCTWTPTQAGTYEIGVWIRGADRVADAPELAKGVRFVVNPSR